MTDLIVENHDAYVVTADIAPETLTERDIRSMYPKLNDKGVANYLLLANRVLDDGFDHELAMRRLRGECLTQPRIREGEPWKSDCLTHRVPDSMGHYFATNPEASTD